MTKKTRQIDPDQFCNLIASISTVSKAIRKATKPSGGVLESSLRAVRRPDGEQALSPKDVKDCVDMLVGVRYATRKNGRVLWAYPDEHGVKEAREILAKGAPGSFAAAMYLAALGGGRMNQPKTAYEREVMTEFAAEVKARARAEKKPVQRKTAA